VGHRARLGENDQLFLRTAHFSEKTYQVPKVCALVHALITQINDAQKGCAMQLGPNTEVILQRLGLWGESRS